MTSTTQERAKPLTKKQIRENEKQEAIAQLRKLAPPGSTIRGIVRSVSRSGMSRTIDFYVVHEGDLAYLTGYFATVLGDSRDKHGALKVSGCGMDMVFGTVYHASHVVWRGTDVLEASKRNGEQQRASAGGDVPGYVWRSDSL